MSTPSSFNPTDTPLAIANPTSNSLKRKASGPPGCSPEPLAFDHTTPSSTTPDRQSSVSTDEARPTIPHQHPTSSGLESASASDHGVPERVTSRNHYSWDKRPRTGFFFQSYTFLDDFILPKDKGQKSLDLTRANELLHELASSSSTSTCEFVSYNELTESYHCSPPSFSRWEFPDWFCEFANVIASATRPTHSGAWMAKESETIERELDNRKHPDFVFTLGEKEFDWHHVLIVGEHESKPAVEDFHISLFHLERYAKRVFLAQPFRSSVLGILTSRGRSCFRVCRFDRCGVVGSYEIDYSSGDGLHLLLLCLDSMSVLPAEIYGFHTSSIDWASKYPINASSLVTVRIPSRSNSSSSQSDSTIYYEELLSHASGINCAGTQVWRGLMCDVVRETEFYVAIKECWGLVARVPEAELYELAYSRGVQGLPTLIHHATYEDVQHGLRHGHLPSSYIPLNRNSHVDEEETRTTTAYAKYMAKNNRVFTRQVFSQVGVPLDSPKLSPLSIARALLAGLIGHASLFFTGKILHRDISPYNILALETPTPLPAKASRRGIYGNQTELYGCLTDLDHALDLSTHQITSPNLIKPTGTHAFMAINVLKYCEPHRYRHDLESFLYVLMYVALYPRPSRRPAGLDNHRWWKNTDNWAHPLREFFESDYYAAVDWKEHLTNCDALAVLSLGFRPGFQYFHSAMSRLQRVLWELVNNPYSGRWTDFRLRREHPQFAAPTPISMVETDSNQFRSSNTSSSERYESPVSCNDNGRYMLVPNEVRLGVSDWDAYLKSLKILEDLVYIISYEEENNSKTHANAGRKMV